MKRILTGTWLVASSPLAEHCNRSQSGSQTGAGIGQGGVTRECVDRLYIERGYVLKRDMY